MNPWWRIKFLSKNMASFSSLSVLETFSPRWRSPACRRPSLGRCWRRDASARSDASRWRRLSTSGLERGRRRRSRPQRWSPRPWRRDARPSRVRRGSPVTPTRTGTNFRHRPRRRRRRERWADPCARKSSSFPGRRIPKDRSGKSWKWRYKFSKLKEAFQSLAMGGNSAKA